MIFKKRKLLVDDFDLDIADIPSGNDVYLNEIHQIVCVLKDEVLVAIHEPVFVSTSTYRFTYGKCKMDYKNKINFENHCRNLCRKSK